MALTGHGIDEHLLSALFESARALFDRTLAKKEALVVGGMLSGRGYEISPEHKEYMRAFRDSGAAEAARRAHHGRGSGGADGEQGSGSSHSTSHSTSHSSINPQVAAAAAAAAAAAEPSALEGILSERFLCGPLLTEADRLDPFYSSSLGPVFFAPDAWPADGVAPGLRARMQGAHAYMTRVAEAAARLMAAALGLEAAHFEGMTRRHCSNLQVGGCQGCARTNAEDPRWSSACGACLLTMSTAQGQAIAAVQCHQRTPHAARTSHPTFDTRNRSQVANYPSQLLDPSTLGPDHMRKKAHTDSGLLTLLASEDWLPGSSWAAGDGGLQLLSARGEWLEVAVPEGEQAVESICIA